ncbi:aspartic proteinase nepenthesin-1-like [Durio zibethinus]|uniref:Aspartic proteinase nepenthesin-1-like n=1 Tax=Durio zibethinus TaxID=66656 RepID=A0A6P5ZMT0_DURZI|nr:aspartic proteinase nepenthesin-1-like [Durio zibethinus]
MDTGGGLIWTQCQPCKRCFPQNLEIYDPRASATYVRLPCSHPLCNGDGRLYDCINGECVYDAQYGGGATTKGVASLESFQFYISNAHTQTFNNVIFGCSNDNSDFSFQQRDVSGIFGLSLSPDSMASQSSSLIHRRFSYCLVPFRDAMPHPVILRFGEDIPQLPPGQVQTTLFVYSSPRRYYFFFLELLDISVANHRLGFHPDTFRTRPDGLGGCYIDSGALLSQIDVNTVGVNAYEAVMTVFAAYYGSRNLKRTTGPGGFELCYETPANYHDFAAITFHFNGADYSVYGENGHFIDPANGFFCVGILRGGGGTVLGAWHQQNKRIIYDGGIGGLQFADEQCVNDIL